MRPLLSVVIANYNYGRFLEDAIKSILSQDVGDQAEIIICDAASTDNSVEIIKKYVGNLPPNVERDPALHLSPVHTPISWWCSEKDGGQSAAFNKGFSHANGAFLTWLNADEIYTPGTFKALFNFIGRHPDARWITSNDYSFEVGSYRIVKLCWGPHWSSSLFRFNRAAPVVFGPSSFMAREVIETVGPFDVDVHYGMDTAYWDRIAKAGYYQHRLNRFSWGFGIHCSSKTAGVQTDEVRARRAYETKFILRRYGPRYCYSVKNIWYCLWMVMRILDGSFMLKYWWKLILFGRNCKYVLGGKLWPRNLKKGVLKPC